MLILGSFHFALKAQGDDQHPPLVQDAEGDVTPPNIQARADIRQGDVLLEVDLIVVGDQAYLKSFTGGWQLTSQQQLARYFDVSSIFSPSTGLFAVLPQTVSPSTGTQESVNGHSTYRVTGQLPPAVVHRLLSLASESGAFPVTYWIDPTTKTLWRIRLSGPLFDAQHQSSVMFEFAHLDQPVTITAPAVG